MTDREIAESRRTKASPEPVAGATRKRQRLFARNDIGFQEAQRLSHTGSFSWQLSPEEITWSEETYRIYEYGPEIKPTMELARRRVHPDDVAMFAAIALRAKQEGKDFEFAHRLLMPDGSIKNLRVVARAAKDGSGKPTGYFGAVMDVTAQRRAQTALEDALKEVQVTRDQFQLAIDAIPGLVWSALPDGHIDFLNRRWREYTGLTLEQAGGWGWRAAIHPEDLPGLESYWRSVLASGKPDEKEARLRRGDGVYRWFLFRVVPLYDEAVTLVKWYGQTIDIDDRKQAEQQVRRSEAYLAEAQTLSRTGSFGWRVPTGELFWSAETYCILGYDQGVTPTLEHVFKRVHPEDIMLVREALERASRERTNLDFEHRLLMPDGEVKHVRVMAAAAEDQPERLEFVGAVMDVTDREQAAEALRASEHLARGQLQALTRTLDALAKESDADKLLEHVMQTIMEQSGGHSVSVWERVDEESALVRLAAIEDGHFETRRDDAVPAMLHQTHPVWKEVIRTPQHAIIEDLDKPVARMRVGFDAKAPWLNVMDDADPDPAPAMLKKSLLQQGARALLVVPMQLGGRVEGVVSVRFKHPLNLRPEEIELTHALAQQATLAIQLVRLSHESRKAAVIAERNRVARDVHDTLAQGFTGVIVQLEAAADASSRGLSSEAEAHSARAGDLARESLKEARRSVLALRPLALEQSDLRKAIAALVRKGTDGTSLRARFQVIGKPRPLLDDWSDNVLRITQELMTNVLRHAHARTIHVELRFESDSVQLQVRDDGIGFDVEQRTEGLGVLGIRERVEQMHGTLIIDSRPGAGTQISIMVPDVQPLVA